MTAASPAAKCGCDGRRAAEHHDDLERQQRDRDAVQDVHLEQLRQFGGRGAGDNLLK